MEEKPVETPLNTSRLLKIQDVLKIWPISRHTLWRYTTTAREADRIPSYRVGGRTLYKYEEIMHYLDSHRNARVTKGVPA